MGRSDLRKSPRIVAESKMTRALHRWIPFFWFQLGWSAGLLVASIPPVGPVFPWFVYLVMGLVAGIMLLTLRRVA